MLRKIIITLTAFAFCMGLGALLALWRCSQRRWCPRYLRHQLDAWRKQMERQNKERHEREALKTGLATPPPTDGDETA